MITYLKGKVIYKGGNSVVLLVNNVGYELYLSTLSLEKVEEGDEKEFWTELVLKEKEAELYGFLSFNELELFK